MVLERPADSQDRDPVVAYLGWIEGEAFGDVEKEPEGCGLSEVAEEALIERERFGCVRALTESATGKEL